MRLQSSLNVAKKFVSAVSAAQQAVDDAAMAVIATEQQVGRKCFPVSVGRK